MKKIILALLIALSSVSGALFMKASTPDQAIINSVGAVNFVGVLPTTLSGSGVNATVSSVGVTSMKISQTSQPLSMADFGSIGYATIEPGVPARQEFISFTGITQNANGTAILTGVVRGLAPVSPYTASSTMRFPHGGATKIIISNSPPFYNNFALQTNNATVTAQWIFPSLYPVRYDTHPTFTIGTELVDKSYADGLSFAGVATSSESNGGLVWLGTALQQASSTNGGANQPFVMQSRYATDTPLSGCAVGYTSTAGAGCSVIATLAGKIKQTFLDIFSTVNTWTGTNTFTATTTVGNLVINGTTTSRYFGGDGRDGALSISSGTTTIDVGGAEVFVRQYSSISITGTGTLIFSNPSSNGTIVILKSVGDVIITSSGGGPYAIFATSTGAPAGAIGLGTTFGTYPGISGNISIAAPIGGRGIYNATSSYLKSHPLYVGAGGGGGSANPSASYGGRGGGSIYIECGGNWNVTSNIALYGQAGGTNGTVYGNTSMSSGSGGGSRISGSNGSNFTSTQDGGGGGGGGGTFVALVNGRIIANSGTKDVSGGAGGTSFGGAGGTGYQFVGLNTEY